VSRTITGLTQAACYRDRRVRLQIIDTAERLEAAANSLGEIRLAIPLSADSLGQDGAEFGFHRTPVAGGAHAQLLLHRWLDIADGQRAHTGYFVRRYAYIIGIVDEECSACDAVSSSGSSGSMNLRHLA
jgi:hypothetical protein